MKDTNKEDVYNLCRVLYENKGASAVYDYANEHKLPYGRWCHDCQAEVPHIADEEICLICGNQSTVFYTPELIPENIMKTADFREDQFSPKFVELLKEHGLMYVDESELGEDLYRFEAVKDAIAEYDIEDKDLNQEIDKIQIVMAAHDCGYIRFIYL